MRPIHLSANSRLTRCTKILFSTLSRRRPRRKLVSLVLVFNLLLWLPGARFTLPDLTVLASQILNTGIGGLSYEASFFRSLFQSAHTPAQREMPADRVWRVSAITVSPHRMVGYIGETVTFVAMGADLQGQLVHGAKFTWESSDANKLSIDEAGRAALLRPGMVIVTARAGSATETAPVLIRPTRRPVQTDSEWRADQDSLVSSAGENGVGSVVASLAGKLAPTAQAQASSWGDYPNATQQVGTPPFAQLEETRLGPVMPTINFELPIPIVNLGGRGLATSLMAYYNSNVWGAYSDPIRNGTVYVFDPIQSWPSPGFSIGFGRIVYYNGYTDTNLVSWHSFMLIDPNGTRHGLGTGQSTGNNTLQTTDGSHITYVGNVLGGTLYYNDGTAVTIGKVNNRLLPTQITDTNGNYIQIAYKWETNFPGIAISYIVDTLGRVISFNYGEWPAPPGSILLTSIYTPTGAVIFNYQTVAMNTNFLLPVAVENAPASFSAVTSLTIPARPAYNFNYSGYGMIYNISAVSGGGTATVTYDYPVGGEEINGLPVFAHRTESPNAAYTYTWSDVTRPDGTTLSLSSDVRELKNSSNQTLSKGEYAYTTDPGGSPAVQSVITTDEIGQQTKVDFDYDSYGNVVNKREYGFEISGQWQVRRRTHYSYLTWQGYTDAYIRNRVTMVEVYDALGNTNDVDDVLVGKTVYSYDNSMEGVENYGGTAAPPGHLSNYGPVGNITGVTRYSDVVAGASVTLNSKIDIFGNAVKTQVSCCSEKTFHCDGHTYWARPCTETSGNPLDKCLTTIRGYDFNTMMVTSVTDSNNQTTTYGYDGAQRPANATYATGASTSTAYSAWGEVTSSSSTYSEGGVNKTVTATAVYDGWGQLTQSVDANGAQTNFTYDIMGRRLTQTNPFPQGGTPGPLTTYQYDQLGRNTLVTLPDGNTVQTAYTGGNFVTVTDQVNRKIKRESDGLGRLIKVTEQDVSTGALTQETTYSYDIADRLTGVNQSGQTRAFKYDSEGRLLFERIPEMTATINDGTGAYWSTKYTYTDWNAVATEQDARGVITTYGYDTLHRLTSISYNTSGAQGVASTPTVTYTYENGGTCDTGAHTVSGGTTKGLLLSVASGTGYSESYSYDSFKRVQAVTRTIDGRNYTTSFQLNTANQATRMTYPSGRVINYGHDDKGRLTSVGSFLTGVTYNGIGQLTGTSLGNGVSETYGYDANRMQLTSQTATKSGGPTNGLMNLNYKYDALAGQMGAGSTAGNAGQLTAINNNSTIGGVAESAAYTYDNLGRLVTSDQTSNGSSAQRRFSHDGWGNRTGMWDAESGGAQIQTVNLEQSGGAPTNRIQSVTGPGKTNFALAANGATVTASSSFSTAYPASAAINGDRKGTNWGSGGGWMDGTSGEFPDWLEVDFSENKTIDEIDVFTVQDNYANPSEPTENMTFSQYGITDFEVWSWGRFGWSLISSATNNDKVWKKITFSPITTGKIRVHITGAADKSYSRVTELEAWGTATTTSNYIYDAAGNVTNDGVHAYQYDAENRIVNVDGGATARYAYDLSNQRYKKVTVGSTTHYIWQGSKVIADHNGSNGAVLTDYVYAGSRMIAKVESGATQYFLSDRLSTRLVLDTSGNVLGRQAHFPYGEAFGESGTQEKHHFTSYERDGESGIDYAINRGYSAVTARFVSADPYETSGYLVDPQSWNRYSYSRNNPIDFVDPNGLNLAAVAGGSLGSISVWAGDGWISADSPGFALLWGYLTGGVGGSGGGIQGPDPSQEPPVPGTVPVQPIPPPPLPLPNVPKGSPKDFVKAMNRSFADLEERLRSRPACAALFGGLENALSILAGTEYRYLELPQGHPRQLPDGGFSARGAQTIDTYHVQINTWGPFLNQTLLVTTPSGVISHPFTFGGLSGTSFQALLLLHELGHQAGVFRADSDDSDLNTRQTQRVYDACFN